MISIRETLGKDVDEIISIHLLSFNKSHFTANFSVKMLHSYFECLLKSCSLSFVAISDDKIVGYIFGGLNPFEGVNHFIKKNFWKVLWIFIKYPQFVTEKIVEKIIDRNSNKKKFTHTPTIYIIAVHPHVKLGIGKKLMVYFEERIKNENLFEYQLSVRKENTGAIKFYESNGFYRSFANRTSYCYYKSLK